VTSAEYVECERIQATVGDEVWLDEHENARMLAGSLMFIDRVTGKTLQPNQCGMLDYGNGVKHRHYRLLTVMLRQSY
jgi:hypothetical protein